MVLGSICSSSILLPVAYHSPKYKFYVALSDCDTFYLFNINISSLLEPIKLRGISTQDPL